MHSYVSGKILCEEGVWLQGLGNVLETPLFATSHPSYQSACFLLTSLCIMAGKETFFGSTACCRGSGPGCVSSCLRGWRQQSCGELPVLALAQHHKVADFSANPGHYSCIFCAERA